MALNGTQTGSSSILDATPAGEPRQCQSWIETFLEYTSGIGSPRIFRLWSAIAAIAGAMERRVWIAPRGPNLYANMFVFLIGPPGVGKTIGLDEAEKFLARSGKVYLAPTSISRASLVDSLDDAKRDVTIDGEHVSYNSLFISAGELGALLPAYDSDFMNTLTTMYDSKRYADRKRGGDIRIEIPNPTLTIIAATTPAYLSSMLPVGAWDQGFLSRVMLVFEGRQPETEWFNEIYLDETLQEKLHRDMERILALYGKMEFTAGAVDLIGEWHRKKGPPTPDHPRLVHYLTRRTAHLCKISMVVCASRCDNLLISADHVEEALSYLIELEERIPDIFRSMASGGESQIIDECYHYIFKIFSKRAKPVLEPEVYAFLKNRTPTYTIPRIVETMVKAGMLRVLTAGGLPAYEPLARESFH